MSVLRIAKMGNPILLEKAKRIEHPTSPEIRALAKDMQDTLLDIGGSGLAAPQVMQGVRMVVYRMIPQRIPANSNLEPIPWTVMVNPEITWLSDKKETDEEGCLSIPRIMANVTRPSSCKIKYLDKNGESKELHANGLLSRCLQHEIDHINGKLFIDYLSKTKKDIILRKFKKIQKEKEQTK